MRIFITVFIGFLLSSASYGQSGPPKEAGLIPIETFSRHPLADKVKISTQGTYLAASLKMKNMHLLSIMKINPEGVKSFYVIRFTGKILAHDFHWVNDERLVIGVAEYKGSEEQPVSYGELFAINADGSERRVVFGYRAGEQQTGSNIKKAASIRAWGEVLDPLPNEKRYVLVKALPMSRDGESFPSVYKVDVYRGTSTRLATAPLTNMNFITDELGNVRMAVGTDNANNYRAYYREKLGDKWKELVNFKGFSKTTKPIGFLEGTSSVYVVDQGQNGVRGLYLVDIDTGKRTKLFQHDKFSISKVVYDYRAKRIAAVEYHPGLPTYAYIDKKSRLSRLLKGLPKNFPGTHIKIPSATADGKKVLMLVYSDRDPGDFYLLDVEKPSVDYLLSVRADVKSEHMAATKHFSFNASDDLEIHAYLTMPNNVEGKKVPLVVMPHGGPHGIFTTWGFDEDVQVLASRGYAVLEVNYRGSGGYGADFMAAGEKHWGDRVQQDIIEGTRYALEHEKLDSKRVCIYGSSFGGYSALQSSILAPDLFKCAIGYAGIYDLAMLFKEGDTRKTRRGKNLLKQVIGVEQKRLQRQSPVFNADKIKAAVLLIHGEDDERAPIDHAEAMKEALEEKGRHVEWLVKDDEGHGFFNEENRKEAYTRILDFLEKHIGKGFKASLN